MIKVGTDFSGIGSPEASLINLDVEHEIEFACEIDKHARASYKAIYGEPKIFYNDITKRDHKEVPQLDLYVGGFPCQSFSVAGKGLGFEDTRGTLFFNVADFIRENQPKSFILENVKGLVSHDNGKTFSTIISVLSDNGGTVNGQMSVPYFDDGLGYHIYYQVLNTKDYGIPQNRERIFIVGFKDFVDFRFPQTFPLELKLKDLLEDNVDDSYYLSEEVVDNLLAYNKRQEDNNRGFSAKFRDVDKVDTMDAIKVGGGGKDDLIKVKSATSKGYEVAKEGDSVNLTAINSKTRRGRVGKEVAQTLDTLCEQAVVKSGTWRTHKEDYGFREIKDGNAPCIPARAREDGSGQPCIKSGHMIRRLTPLECWRLQAYSDESFRKAESVVSNTQLYKQAGNSISVNVMQLILKNVIEKI